MVDLAGKTIVYEWRRFAPAIFAVAFSGVLLLVQAALALGMFETIGVYVRKSDGDLWIVSPGTRSIDQGRPLNANVEALVRFNPHVSRVEPFSWGGGLWRAPGQAGDIPVFLTSVDPDENGLVLAHAVSKDLRARLIEPYTVLIDVADKGKLNVDIGDSAEINGVRVRVVGFMRGMRALGGVNVVSSLATARQIDPSMRASDAVAYFVAKIDDPANVDAVQSDLSPRGESPRYEAIRADAFADRTTMYWLFETGMGVIFIVSSAIALFVSLMITSQTLMAAVAASIREYATMRAIGIPDRSLRHVVLAQSGWVGVFGLGLAALISIATIAAAAAFHVPIAASAPIILVCAVLVFVVALGSGLVSLGQLAKADPATLLR